MRLEILTEDQCQIVRIWRNQCLESLRTPYPLTPEEQSRFFYDVVQNRSSPHRYWGVCAEWLPNAPAEPHDGLYFCGMGGLTYIQWENRIAEISLILSPAVRSKGLGEQAVDLLLAEGFDRMGLKTIFGECYYCNDAHEFWLKITEGFGGYITRLPNRKFWAGQFWDSLYFSIDGDCWRQVHGQSS